MVIIAEVTAICDLLLTAAEFSTHIRDGLYKGSAELNDFPTKVALLSAKHSQWTSLLERFGMTDDEHLKPLVNAAVQILDKERDYVSRMQRSRLMRLKKRVFPGQLTHILSSLVELVDASRQQLETRVESHNLLERSLGQTPLPLPFGRDSKYVPLSSSITEVQKALEDANGRRVVTVHGGAGTGKSSLVKYLALHYENARKEHTVAGLSTPLCFPNGVFYLLCERGAQARVNQLQMKLLESLGGGGGSLMGQPTSAPGQRDFVHIPSHQTKLRFHLAKQKLLIILDDVWEGDLVEKLLVPGEGVKYLVTSQIRSIWSDATMIELKNPDIAQARKIMASYTEGLPTAGEFPDNIKDEYVTQRIRLRLGGSNHLPTSLPWLQSVTDRVIQELEYHPLSLANVGLTINRRRATDAKEWEVAKESLRDQVDEIDLNNSPVVYEKRYPLAVGASMMLMVNSLPPGPRHLLFLIGLLTPRGTGTAMIPECLVKVFLKFTEQRWKYQNCINYLEDRSLVELRRGRVDGIIIDEVNTSRFYLATHGLRTYFIRKKHIADMKCIATEILSGRSESSGHDGQLIQSGSTEETRALPVIMGAIYFGKPFNDLVVPELESHITIFNGGVIPRSMSYEVDARDLMGKAERLKNGLQSLVWLLNPDEEGGWKGQAHDYATKVVIKLAVRKELDDGSMASLIQLPQTSTAACKTLLLIVKHCLDDAFAHAYLDQKRTFSSGHGKTMDSLLCLLQDNAATISRRVATISPLKRVLDYETEDTILRVAKKWVEFLGKNSSPTLQTAVTVASRLWYLFEKPSRTDNLLGGFPEVLDHLLILTVEGKDSNLQGKAAWRLSYLCRSSDFVSRAMAIPGALNMLFKKFLSSGKRRKEKNEKTDGYDGPRYHAGRVLRQLSCHPENRIRFTTIDDSLKGLTEMLTSNPKSQSSCIQHEYSAMAAEIVGNLALTNEVREVILQTAPQIGEGLVRLLQLWISSPDPKLEPDSGLMTSILSISRAMTILDPLQAKAIITTIPRPHPRVCFEVYMGRVRGYMEMGMYSDALIAFSMIADEFPPKEDTYGLSWVSWFRFKNGWGWSSASWWREFTTNFRSLRLFLKTMTEDYIGAMIDANRAIQDSQDIKKKWPINHYISNWMSLGERGVLKRLLSIDLREALVDLDEALALWDGRLKYDYHSGQWEGLNLHKLWYGCLKHRGLVKSMMRDEVGARVDAESAVQLKLDREVYEDTNDALGLKCLLDLPVDYLGFTL